MFGTQWTISSGGRKPTRASSETCRTRREKQNVPTSSVLAGLRDFAEWLISELQCWYWIPETKWNTNPLWNSHVPSYSTHRLPVLKNSSWGKSISDRLHQTSPALIPAWQPHSTKLINSVLITMALIRPEVMTPWMQMRVKFYTQAGLTALFRPECHPAWDCVDSNINGAENWNRSMTAVRICSKRVFRTETLFQYQIIQMN